MKKFRVFKDNQSIEIPKERAHIVLVGPNNNGKTSFCDAIQILFGGGHFRTRRSRRRMSNATRPGYDYLRDYPKQIKKNKGRVWPTEFLCEIELSEAEFIQYSKEYNITGKNVSITKTWNISEEEFELKVKNPTIDSSLEDEFASKLLASFQIVTVPAIREPEALNAIFENLFETVVRERIENSKKIKNKQKELIDLLQPEIKKTNISINKILSKYLGKEISLELEWQIQLNRAVDLDNIQIDDGVKTPFDLKGDGIKSLSLIALITELAQLQMVDGSNQNMVFIIEEPEAHLNSTYLYPLKESISDLAKNATVILTTHSPVFIDFYNHESNYIVKEGKVYRPNNRKQIADCLGVKLQENLVSKENCLVVEGHDDKAFVEILLGKHELAKFNTRFEIVPAIGVDNVTSSYVTLTNLYRKILVLIDNDKQSNDHLKKMGHEKILPENIFKIPTPDSAEAEIEDLIDLDCMSELLTEITGRKIAVDSLKSIKKKYKGKWSTWMTHLLNQIGNPVNNPEDLKAAIWGKRDKIKFSENHKLFLKTFKDKLLS